MNRWEELAELRELLKEQIGKRLVALFGWTLTSNISAIGDKDQVESADDAVDPGTKQKTQRPVTRVQPWGLVSRAPGGLRSLWLSLGSSNAFLIGIGPQQKYGPQNLQPGETALYNTQTGCQILLDQSGNISITAAANANVNVTASGTGSVSVSAAPGTGAVKLGPVANLPVLVQGTVDSLGIPVTQAPAAVATIVKAG